MKKMMVCVAGVACAASAFGQSSVTLYGAYDAGITYVSNQNGKSNAFFQGGIMTSTGFGIRGSEYLGNGTKAIFDLRNSTNSGTGAEQNGGIFGKAAWVGLANDKLGTVTLGNQADFMFKYLTDERWGPMKSYLPPTFTQAGPFPALNLPAGSVDFDRTANVFPTNNAIAYESTRFNGLKFGAMYGFGQQAGSLSKDSTQSFGMDYANNTVNLQAAYTYTRFPNINNGNNGIRNWGLGGRTALFGGDVAIMFSNTENTFNKGQVNVFQIDVTHPVAPSTTLGVSYQFDMGNQVLNDDKAQQISMNLMYSLSVRTDIYLMALYQHASGKDAFAYISGAGSPSSNQNQMAVRLAIVTRF